MENPLEKKCRYCKGPLTSVNQGASLRCLSCHPMATDQKPPTAPERKYVDVRPDEDRVREIVNEELDKRLGPNVEYNSPTEEFTPGPEQSEQSGESFELSGESGELEPFEAGGGADEYPRQTWRQRAKELDINTFQMTKAEALKRIKEVEASL